MTTARPTGYDSFTRPTTGASFSSGTTKASTLMDNLMDAMEAVEAELGLKPGAETRDFYEMMLDTSTGHDHGVTGGGKTIEVPAHDHSGGGVGQISHDTDIADISVDDHHTEQHAAGGSAHTGSMTLDVMGQEWVYKTGDQSFTSNTTLANITDLDFDVDASSSYIFTFGLFITGATAGDVKVDITGPASPTAVHYQFRGLAIGATAFPAVQEQNAAISTAFSTSLAAGTAGGYAFYELIGMLRNGTNSGTVQLRGAQQSSSGTATTFKTNSWVFAQKVA